MLAATIKQTSLLCFFFVQLLLLLLLDDAAATICLWIGWLFCIYFAYSFVEFFFFAAVVVQEKSMTLSENNCYCTHDCFCFRSIDAVLGCIFFINPWVLNHHSDFLSLLNLPYKKFVQMASGIFICTSQMMGNYCFIPGIHNFRCR